MLLKLAFLNIGRNPRRSLVTILAVAVGLGALIFLWGFSDGTIEGMRENVIKFIAGHVEIHGNGFDRKMSVENTVRDHAMVVDLIKKQNKVISVTERAKCEALIGTSENSRGVLLIGVDPAKEKTVTRLHEFVNTGSFLNPDDKRGILIGDKLAEKIGVKLDDKVVIMTQAMDGTLAGFSYRIKGIYHSGSQLLDEMSALITLQSAQELLGMDDQVHEIVIRLTNRKAINVFLDGIKPGLKPEDYEVLTWNQVVPDVEQWSAWGEAIIRTILVAVMFVIGVGIMNTVLMSVFERIREFGVMMAIGTSPRQIMLLICMETFVLELIGIILGVIIGYAVTFYYGKVGIAFHDLESAFSKSFMSTVTYPQVSFKHVVQSIVTLFVMTSLISLYPAWKAGRMEPVKAIYRS